MKEIQTKSGKILCVEIPEDTTWWQIIENNLGGFITETLGLNQQFLKYGKSSIMFGKEVKNIVYYNPDSFHLPEGRWKIIGKLSELTDEDCEEFVEKLIDPYEKIVFLNYPKIDEVMRSFERITAKESFISLLQSEGVDTSNEDKLLIIKVL